MFDVFVVVVVVVVVVRDKKIISFSPLKEHLSKIHHSLSVGSFEMDFESTQH